MATTVTSCAFAVVITLAALLAREFGALPRAQVFAAGCTAESMVVIAVVTCCPRRRFDLLTWTTLKFFGNPLNRVGVST